ncbi:MAG: hypothetical protein RJA22_2245 [Verrucomicrobiota bacterium]
MPAARPTRLHRRAFLGQAALATAALAARPPALQATDARPDSLIASIEKVTLRVGRTGPGPTWFHPKVCLIPQPAPEPPLALMTLQSIAGSDYYGPVHSMTSRDLGRTWTEPRPVPALGRVPHERGAEEAVCDVVPEWHSPSRTVLALGQNVFYSGPRFSPDQPPRRPVYAVWRDGAWGPRRHLEWKDPRGAAIYSNNCGQRVTLPNGDVLLALSHAASLQEPRAVSAALCSFDGKTLAIREVGPALQHRHRRGLLEPSLIRHGDRYWMTLRAEDNRGYVTTSTDGLRWEPQEPWAWDDGEPLTMSTTQQHWLPHAEGLFLVYTRKDASNVNVPRWRAPLYLAEVDTQRRRLRRATERIVLPLVGDGVKAPDDVAYSGNFHPVNVTADEAWVTDGEILPKRGWKGDLLLARIRWKRPDRRAG